MRDEFSNRTKELLARRVGFQCSRPGCEQRTSGPQMDPSKAVNLGVAAHVRAASPGGPRYDADRTSEMRSSPDNGVWLCYSCSKLVDSDVSRYSVQVLQEWKRSAEDAAARALEKRYVLPNSFESKCQRAARQMPGLLAEMEKDLEDHPLRREFVLLGKGWAYDAFGHELAYYLEDHADLISMLAILVNLQLVEDITYNSLRRYHFTEDFVDWLSSSYLSGEYQTHHYQEGQVAEAIAKPQTRE